MRLGLLREPPQHPRGFVTGVPPREQGGVPGHVVDPLGRVPVVRDVPAQHVDPVAVPGGPVREVLDALFDRFPTLRGYATDERGALRHHVVAFVNGVAVRDKDGLAEPVPADGEVYLFQALSGGSP